MTSIRSFPATRMRRLRAHAWSRDLVREHRLSTDDLIYPVFVSDEGSTSSVSTMPGIKRFSFDDCVKECERAATLGIKAVALFPKINESLKSPDGIEALNSEGLIPKIIRKLKATVPNLGIIADVALDPYTSHGQDGIIDKAGEIINDITVAQLAKQSCVLASAGADVVAPSDMMDGRIGIIRIALDKAGHDRTMILSYAAKYASCFYGPFRDAVGSAKSLAGKSKSSYQMDSANADEAIHEVALDLQEGADIVMVKPGMPYLDIIHRIKTRFEAPVFAYQVSGEYAMILYASQHQALDLKSAVLESLLSFKRAGSDAILTYFAPETAQWLNESHQR
jgi:porphobilinogen synthase